MVSLFITFEGIEGCGKTTQSRALYRRLNRLAIPALLTHEPGGTPLGARIARLLKWTDRLDISPEAELLLFNASRAQLVGKVLRPALEKGVIVICDRYADSTTAYQGYGRGLEMAAVQMANRAGTLGLRPDLTILLDLPVPEGLARKMGSRPDRFEVEGEHFHRRVRQGYLEMAAAEPERWLLLDARKSRREIASAIWQKVSRMLSGRAVR